MSAPHFEEQGSHPDRFQLNLLAVKNLEDAERAELEAHLEDCTPCRERLWRLKQDLAMAKRAMPEAMPVAEFRQRLARERGRTVAWISAAAGWAAAACVLLVWSPWKAADATPPVETGDEGAAAIEAGTRAKGAFGISVMRGRGDTVERLGPVALCRAGDRLQFAPDLPDHGYLQIVNVQDDGAIQAYLPSTPVDQVEQRLAYSIELDDYVGRERIYFVWSPEPVDAGDVRTALLASLSQQPIEEVPEVALPGGVEAVQHSVLIYKEATP